MNNQDRRKIINQAKADGYQGSYVDLFRQAEQDPTMIAQTPDQKQAGLRPFHEAGRTDASMAFPDVPPNTPFNTVGMKAPIDIKKYDEQGHLVKSYENVPPGLTNIDSGPARGMVLETPTRMQEGDFVKTVEPMDDDDPNAPQIGDPGADRGSLFNTVLADLYNVETRASDKANEAVKASEVPGEGDSYRHALASAYAVNKLRSYGLSPGMSLLGANAMGLFHELTAKSNNTFRESAEDVFNNLAGSLVGVFQDDKGAEATTKMLANRILPDGMAQEYKNYQVGGFASDNTRVSMPAPPEMYLNEAPPQPTQTFLGPQPDISAREKEGLDKMFKADQRRREQVAKGVNPNTAFMTPPGLGADNEARAAYEYDNPATSNIGQIAGGIGFLPIDKGLDIAMTAAGAALRKNFKPLFKSEIDWGAWNPDTPNHPSLMEEYRNIEFQTKKNGTWMRNADGSPFRGRPEQFIQENSSHFKKAFPEGAYRTSRGIKIDPTEIDPLTGKTYPDMDIDPGFGYKPVFSADPQLASTPYYSGWGQPERLTPFTKRNWGKPQGFVADLYAKESPNSYRIVSQGDNWKELRIAGAPKDEIERRLTSQKIGLDIEKGKPAQYRNESKINQLETEISRYEWFAKNYDRVVNKTPSKVPDFEQVAIDKFGNRVQTDYLGELGYKKGLDDIRMFGLNDGDWGAHVNMHMNRPGNFLKSSTGNVGFFDMRSDDIFKAAAPIGIGAGLMSQRKHGGYRKAQQGTVVDYLLPALEANNPTEFADTQASNQAQNVRKRQADLSAEQQRVQDVRANVIPTAENLEQLNYDILNANNIFGSSSEYRPHLAHFNKMKRAKTPAEYKELEAEAKKSYPELLEAIPENNIMVMKPSKYNADDELYCTPYGCYTYKKAGATDVPEYSGNYGFVGGVKSGKNPFKRISAEEAEPGDIALMTEYSPVDYRDPSKGRALRPHHTTILSQKTNNPDEIYAYQADDGTRLKFRENKLKARDVRDDEGKVQEGRFDYYRYIGQTPYMQRAVGDAKHNQKQADMVAQAMQQQADIAAQIPDRDLTDLETIDRRGADKIKTNDVSQDIVDTTTEVPEQKKSGKQKVEQLSNTLQGKVETAKERKARIKAINKRTRQNIRNIRKG